MMVAVSSHHHIFVRSWQFAHLLSSTVEAIQVFSDEFVHSFVLVAFTTPHAVCVNVRLCVKVLCLVQVPKKNTTSSKAATK